MLAEELKSIAAHERQVRAEIPMPGERLWRGRMPVSGRVTP